MKSFTKILTESKKQYAFRVKLAVGCSKDDLADLKSALDKYKVAAMSEPKITPIIATHMDFPHLNNVDVTIIDILTDYPANPVQIREIIRDTMKIAETHIMVTSPQSDEDAKPVEPKKGVSVIDKPYEDEKKRFDILGELKKVLDDHETRKFEFAAKSDAKPNSTNELPQNNTSIMGTLKNKKPLPTGRNK
jgi:hypothetical protein